ncbi:hypothetical protein V1277_003782 [Bradyrhizobium sp. AZCC 1588]
MTEASEAISTPPVQPDGRVFRWAFAYDVLLRVIWEIRSSALNRKEQ